jgi:hypothetical protein
VLAAGPNGNITIYEDKLAVREIQGHDVDGVGKPCNCLTLHSDGESVLSGGADGKVRTARSIASLIPPYNPQYEERVWYKRRRGRSSSGR